MRFSLLSSFLVILFFPFTAWSLGLGDISIKSSLNSPLDAKIELKSVTAQDLESLDVQMASDRDFRRSDIENIDILKQLKFKLISNDGAPYIHVTTHSILREPFINFLIDIQWHAGRILREYTLLVDPPEVMSQKSNQQPGSSRMAKKSLSKKSSQKHLAPSHLDSATLTYGPTREDDTLWSVAHRMRPSLDISMAQMMLALQRENPDAFNKQNINGLMSGFTLKISAPDLLTKISKQAAQINVNEQEKQWKQIVNNTLPSDSLSPDKMAASMPTTTAVENLPEQTKDESKLELLSSNDVSEAQNVSSGSLNQGKMAFITMEQLESKLALYEERIQSQTQENEELKNHIVELEKILEKRESLLSLQDENLAILQAKQQQNQEMLPDETDKAANLSTTEDMGAIVDSKKELDAYVFNDNAFSTNISSATIESDDDTEETTDSIIADVDSTKIENESIKTGAEILKADLEQPELEKVEPEIVTSHAKQDSIQATSPSIEKKQIEVSPVAVKETIKPIITPIKPVDQKLSGLDLAFGFAEDLFQSASALAEDLFQSASALAEDINKNYFNELLIAGGSLILLFLVSIFSRRKKNKDDEDFQESILNDTSIATDKDYADETDGLNTAEIADSTGLEDETSFLSDFSSSELDSLQPDDTESDPVSEANVFMVYGRYDQAEEMLTGVIKKQPDNLDYQMKLLDVYHAGERQDEFKKQSSVVKNILITNGTELDDSGDWKTVQKLANDLNLGVLNDTTDLADLDLQSSDSILSESNDDLELELADDEIDVDDLERQLNEFEAMLADDFDEDSYNVETTDKINNLAEENNQTDSKDINNIDALSLEDVSLDEVSLNLESINDDLAIDLDDLPSIEKSGQSIAALIDKDPSKNKDSLAAENPEYNMIKTAITGAAAATITGLVTNAVSSDNEANNKEIADNEFDTISLDDKSDTDSGIDLEDLNDNIDSLNENPSVEIELEADNVDLSAKALATDDMEFELEGLSESVDDIQILPVEDSLDNMELDLEGVSDSTADIDNASIADSLEDMELDLDDLSDSTAD
ncbi:MAG: FimV/HubP family polar landmark protein, partial [Pseudomonadota bacterium]